MEMSKARIDGQLTGLAGELFVAAELARRNLQVSVTFGNAKAIDLVAVSLATNNRYTIQVKSLRHGKSEFPMRPDKSYKCDFFVFVILPDPPKPVGFFIVPEKDLDKKPNSFGKYFVTYKTFPSVNLRCLESYRDNWDVFA